MALLDLSVKNFTLHIGDFEITDFLTAFTISHPNSEINQQLFWSGTFELAVTDKVFRQSSILSESDFSEVASPLRWRRGLQTVTLTIDGYLFPPLLIADYVYENRIAKGSLTQLNDLLSFSRQGKEIEGTAFTLGQPIADVINSLFLEAGKVTTVAHGTVVVADQSKISPLPALTGVLTTKLTTDNPIALAQNLAVTNWHWVSIALDGKLTLVERPEYGTPILRRAFSEINIKPLTDNIHFAADQVVVTGSREEAKKAEDAPPVIEENDDFNEDGKPRKVRTETIETIGSVFADLKPGDETPYTTGVKTVFYRYAGRSNDSAFNPNLYVNLSGEANYECNQYPSVNSAGIGDVIQTITVDEIIVGKLFKDDLPEPNEVPPLPTTGKLTKVTHGTISPAAVNIPTRLLGFIIGNISIETPTKKVSFVPYGSKFSDVDVDLNRKIQLTLERSETLRSSNNTTSVIESIKDPLTGKALKLEDRVKAEDQQKAPLIDYETVPIRGQYDLVPNGYNTFLPQTYTEDFGFLPDDSLAYPLARKIAIREFARRDAKQFFMEMPREWATLGFPFFPIFDLHDGRRLVENPIITMSKRQMVFSFTGEKLGDIESVIEADPIMPYMPVEGLNIYITNNLSLATGSPVTSQILAIGGNPPYSFSADSLPDGLSISPDGLITGVPSVAIA
jgi:hypothetical protein